MRCKAIVVDLDGTLCDNAHRVCFVDGSQPKDWNKFNALSANDPPNKWCLDLVNVYSNSGYEIVFLTARAGSDETRAITNNWLLRYIPNIAYSLHMRKDGDFRPDFVVKQEIYNLNIAPYHDVQLAIDDKQAVCSMFRSMGITALHCTDY